MARSDLLRRNYIKPDDKMLEQAQTMRNLFDADSADFIALYTDLAAPFSSNWQADIDAAQALPIADEQVAELAVMTEDVETQMELARVQFQKLASYVRILFPDSKPMQGIFGMDKYARVYQSKTKLYDLMEFAYRQANSAEYKTDLIAKGFLQTDIDKLNTLAGALYDAYEAQEKFKKVIRVLTEERVTAYNKVWDSMAAVSMTSKQVYRNSFAKMRQYLLYPEGIAARTAEPETVD